MRPAKWAPRPSVHSTVLAGTMIAAGVFAACGTDARARGEGVVQRGDTTIVGSESPAVSGEATMERVAVFGVFEGDSGPTLNSVWVHDVGPSGALYLMDGNTGLKRFESDGAFGDWLARIGPGPGEVRNGRALTVRQDGTVAYWDLGNDRIATFDDGEFNSTRVGARRVQYTEGALTWVGDTLWAIAASPLVGSVGSEGPRLLRLDSRLAIHDSITVPREYFRDCPTLSESRFRTGFWEDQRDPWVPKVRISIGSDGRVVFGCPATFEFDVVHPDGSVLRVRWNRQPIPVQDSEISDVSGPIFTLSEQPSHRPAYSRVILEPSGRMWVWLSQPSVLTPVREEFIPLAGKSEVYRLRSGDGVFDVFEADGRWVGSVRIPPEVKYSGHPTEPALVVRGDTVWAAFEDEFEVQYVGKYVVRWPLD